MDFDFDDEEIERCGLGQDVVVFGCPLCGERDLSEALFVRHVTNYHLGDWMRVMCPICCYLTGEERYYERLAQHMLAEHISVSSSRQSTSAMRFAEIMKQMRAQGSSLSERESLSEMVAALLGRAPGDTSSRSGFAAGRGIGRKRMLGSRPALRGAAGSALPSADADVLRTPLQAPLPASPVPAGPCRHRHEFVQSLLLSAFLGGSPDSLPPAEKWDFAAELGADASLPR